jgi:phosphate acyltransferase
MKIAIDAMGGDKSPLNILKGIELAAESLKTELVVVGDSKIIRENEKKSGLKMQLPLVHAGQVVGMDEDPLVAIKHKRESSIMVASRLLSDGKVEGFVTAGNSGAASISAIHAVGNFADIKRPALVSHFETEKGTNGVILDIGANVDADEENLCQFAAMGSAYAKALLNIEEPRVGILSNGSEDTKGNKTTHNANKRLKKEKRLNYLGFIEGDLLFKGQVDVIICDGFVGNIVLKSSEGIVNFLKASLKETAKESGCEAQVGYFTSRFAGIDRDVIGGALLLGIKAVMIVCHGSASPLAIKNAILKCEQYLLSGFQAKFEKEYLKLSGIKH